jgi:TRAP-type uncharacterized transport system substrate-binding protein
MGGSDIRASELAGLTVSDRLNNIGIIADEAGSTSLQMISELAALAPRDFRIVPTAGMGPLQNINDLLHLKGVDAAVVQTDVLDQARAEGSIAEMDDKLRILARLNNREVHLIGRAELPDFASLKDKRVNIGPAGSGAAVTAAALFEAAGMTIMPTRYDHRTSLHLLKTGQIDAMLYVGGKPVPFLERIDAADGLKLVAVPFMTSMAQHYVPSHIVKRDYGGLLGTQDAVETVSVGSALVVFNWPEDSRGYKRLDKLSDLLFANMSKLQEKPRHDKWRTVNLAAALPGWQRHAVAQRGLTQSSAESTGDEQIEKLRTAFKAILNEMPETASAQ